MKPSQVIAALSNSIRTRRPTMLWGPPGVGKSRVAEAVARAYGEFIDLRLSQLDVVDLRGIPVVKNDRTVWMTPDMFPRKGKGVLFLDEFVQATPLVMSGASQLILDRKLGDYTLPEGWAVLAAGNRESDRAATNRMPSHLANRFRHVQFEVDVTEWIQWAFAAKINPMIIAFLGFRPELLHKFDPAQKAYPTPRSWADGVHKALGDDALGDCLLEVIAGDVGEAAATEFIGFVKIFRELPDFEEIRKKPTSVKVPDNVAARYSVSTMLAQRTERADMKAVMQYVGRMPKEFQVLTVQDMTRHTPELAETSSYIGWAAANKDVLLNSTAR